MIYMDVRGWRRGLPFLCTRHCCASGLKMRFICKINKEQSPHPFSPLITPDETSNTHGGMHPLSSTHAPSTRTHTQHGQPCYEIGGTTILIKDDHLCPDKGFFFISSSLQEAPSSQVSAIFLLGSSVYVSVDASPGCPRSTTHMMERNQISSTHCKVGVQFQFTCHFLSWLFGGER